MTATTNAKSPMLPKTLRLLVLLAAAFAPALLGCSKHSDSAAANAAPDSAATQAESQTVANGANGAPSDAGLAQSPLFDVCVDKKDGDPCTAMLRGHPLPGLCSAIRGNPGDARLFCHAGNGNMPFGNGFHGNRLHHGGLATMADGGAAAGPVPPGAAINAPPM